jgi:hypothetical protein
MATAWKLSDDCTPGARGRPLARLLRGYCFRVCEDAAAAAQALAVRRRVYVEECGYSVAIPDRYDARSWLLVAEDASTGEAVGTMRITPRAAGPLEAEEYFDLPPSLRLATTAEITRFAVLPAYRSRAHVLPAVASGLVKLAILVLEQAHVCTLVVCATPARVWLYSWLNMEATGRVARYRKLGNTPHELLVCDLHEAIHETGHRFKASFLDVWHPEVLLPGQLPPLPGALPVAPPWLADGRGC